MAVLPSKNSGKAKQHASGVRFRQRKISVKQPLAIFKQKDLPSLDNSNELEPSQIHHLSANGQQQRDVHAIETGVDKNEEDEVHLQQVINAAQKALLGSKKSDNKKDLTKDHNQSVYIPTPDASKLWPDAHKFYNDQVFREPESYIKFSATVEDTVGVEFNMDEEDELFLNNVLNKSYPKVKKGKQEPGDINTRKCSDSEFEMVCDRLEKTIEERQPFLSMDPTNILSYQELSSYILDEFKSSNKTSPHVQSGSNLKYLTTTTLKEKLANELNYEVFATVFDKNPLDQSSTTQIRTIPKLYELFGEPIYEHWKARKIERKGSTIHPMLKFEDPNANEKENDNDPYVCFRRREFRQARKTRRADTLGAERIRLLQKSLHRARDLIMSVSQRELLKLETWETDHAIFKLRSEAKSLKRAVGVKGDDYLFFPHKRKKVIRIKDEDDSRDAANKLRRGEKRRDTREGSALPGTATIGTNAVNKDKNNHIPQQQIPPEGTTTSSTQPYVKLPPSKIPDMDLVTVSLVLKEKNETIKRAVLEKLRKRKEQDKGFMNVTDDPYQPYFNISTNKDGKELNHIPYSSIAAANFHQINTTNYLSDSLKKLLEDGKKSLPGMKTFRGSNGELIPSKAFPHLSSLLQDKMNNNKYNSVSYIAQLLSNIETHNFSAYNNGYSYQQQRQQTNESEDESKVSEPIFRLRKRSGRNNRTFIDRRGLFQRPDDEIDEFLTFENESEEDEEAKSIKTSGISAIPNVYDSRVDRINRLDSNWKYDDDLTESERGIKDPFSLDPSRLNCISDETQSIRFGSMLLSKSYGLLRESVHQRQQAFIQQAKLRALQQQQLANKQKPQSMSQPSSQNNQNSQNSQIPSQPQQKLPTRTSTNPISQSPSNRKSSISSSGSGSGSNRLDTNLSNKTNHGSNSGSTLSAMQTAGSTHLRN